MSQKFVFDPETQELREYRVGWQQWMWRGILMLMLMGAGAAVTIYGFNHYWDTPEEQILKSRLLEYQYRVEQLSAQVRDVSRVVQALEEKDEKIYRVIFEAQPIDPSIRQGGFGGARRYDDLIQLDPSGKVAAVAQKVDKLRNQVYFLTRSFEEIGHLAMKKEDWARHKPVIIPIPGDKIKRFASGFGYRVHPFYKIRKFHKGVDFSARKGTPIYATGDGVVKVVKRSRKGYGNMIIIDHGYGYETLYAHMSKFNVRQGQKVKRGDVIGYVGSTGLSMAPHLHYEVHKDGRPVNPIYYFHNDLTPDDYALMIEKDRHTHQSFD